MSTGRGSLRVYTGQEESENLLVRDGKNASSNHFKFMLLLMDCSVTMWRA